MFRVEFSFAIEAAVIACDFFKKVLAKSLVSLYNEKVACQNGGAVFVMLE